MRCYRLDHRWAAANAERREMIGDELLTKLGALREVVDAEAPPYISDPETRLHLQHMIGMAAARVTLDLGRTAEAMNFAREFNSRCQQLLNLAAEEGLIADNPELFEQFTKINKDCYDEVTTAWQG
jgi:hypothetical protein